MDSKIKSRHTTFAYSISMAFDRYLTRLDNDLGPHYLRRWVCERVIETLTSSSLRKNLQQVMHKGLPRSKAGFSEALKGRLSKDTIEKLWIMLVQEARYLYNRELKPKRFNKLKYQTRDHDGSCSYRSREISPKESKPEIACKPKNANSKALKFDQDLGSMPLRRILAHRVMSSLDDLYLKMQLLNLLQEEFPKNNDEFFRALEPRMSQKSMEHLWERLVEEAEKYRDEAKDESNYWKEAGGQAHEVLDVFYGMNTDTNSSKHEDKSSDCGPSTKDNDEMPTSSSSDFDMPIIKVESQDATDLSYPTVDTPFGLFRIYDIPKPETFKLEPTSGYFYDKATGFYHDKKTGYFFDLRTQEWLFYSKTFETYIACRGGDEALKKVLI